MKHALMGKMLKNQMKKQGVSGGEQEKLMQLVEKNPELFEKIAKETQLKMKNEGKSQMTAAMEVMKKHQGELQKLQNGN